MKPPEEDDERMTAAIEQHLLTLLERSAKHDKWLESIDHRLGVLNGSVARHDRKLEDVQAFMVTHPNECEAGEKVDKLWAQMERKRVADDRERKINHQWHRRLNPAYVLCVILFILLVVGHGDLVAKALSLLGIGK